MSEYRKTQQKPPSGGNRVGIRTKPATEPVMPMMEMGTYESSSETTETVLR